MVSYCGFQSISTDVEPLPAGVTPVSPDVETAALKRGVDVYELPLVYVITASKPTL